VVPEITSNHEHRFDLWVGSFPNPAAALGTARRQARIAARRWQAAVLDLGQTGHAHQLHEFLALALGALNVLAAKYQGFEGMVAFFAAVFV
jgi:hypothetical protein